MADELVLDIKNLVVHYETEDADVHAVNGIDLSIAKKRTLGLVGESRRGQDYHGTFDFESGSESAGGHQRRRD